MIEITQTDRGWRWSFTCLGCDACQKTGVAPDPDQARERAELARTLHTHQYYGGCA